tara:strand:- start:22977 stop:23504 length:528 start_codon:yes stop_codon:yes gene_type:complete
MKIAIVIGHTERAKGAYSPHLKMSEWDFWNKVVDGLHNVKVFRHNPKLSGYTNRIKQTAAKLKSYDLVIETHFNAASPEANGCETLYYFKSLKGRKYASLFSEIVSASTGIKLRNRGLKALVNENDRGFAAVYYPAPPTILIEPFFGSNARDCQKIGDACNMQNIILSFMAAIQK